MTNQVNQAFEEWIPPYWNKNKHIEDITADCLDPNL